MLKLLSPSALLFPLDIQLCYALPDIRPCCYCWTSSCSCAVCCHPGYLRCAFCWPPVGATLLADIQPCCTRAGHPALLSHPPVGRFQDSRDCCHRHSLRCCRRHHSVPCCCCTAVTHSAPGLAVAPSRCWTPSLSSLCWTARSVLRSGGPPVSRCSCWTSARHSSHWTPSLASAVLDPQFIIGLLDPQPVVALLDFRTRWFPSLGAWCLACWTPGSATLSLVPQLAVTRHTSHFFVV
jgi:hypothetical protein